MYVSRTQKGSAFPKGEIMPYGTLPLEPAATVLNYGQGLFEGIKGLKIASFFTFLIFVLAFRSTKDRIVIFRPSENSRRMNKGASKFLMPPVPEEVFMDAVSSIVRYNSHWVPPVDR